MASHIAWLDSFFYNDFKDGWDNELFRNYILRHLRPDFRMMDLGAGAGIVKELHFKGRTEYICGVDPDERVMENMHVDEGIVGVAEHLPFPDENFDLIFSANVMEHLQQPQKAFCEVARVLRKGGLFLLKTPNRKHYVSIIARMTPHAFHEFINKKRGRSISDTFPTYYRANTPLQIRQYADSAGLRVRHIAMIEGRPEYLRLNAFTYLCGILFERLTNSINWLANYRVLIMAALEKP